MKKRIEHGLLSVRVNFDWKYPHKNCLSDFSSYTPEASPFSEGGILSLLLLKVDCFVAGDDLFPY